MVKTDRKYPPMKILMVEYRVPPTLEGPPGNFSPYHWIQKWPEREYWARKPISGRTHR